jgi:hypothetical protein
MPRFASLSLLLGCSGGVTDVGNLDSTGEPCVAASSELDEECACEAPSIVIGSGATAYEPLAEGSPLTMVHGPQGGWHMLGSAQFANLLPIVAIHYTITVVADGTVISDNNYRVQMVRDATCSGYFPGMYGYLDVAALAEGDSDTPPELLGGAELELRMEVVDTEERSAVDTLRVVAELDPTDAEEPAE